MLKVKAAMVILKDWCARRGMREQRGFGRGLCLSESGGGVDGHG